MEDEEFYVSGFTNCQKCNSFLTEYNQCPKCFKRLCKKCCVEARGKNCPLCNFFPFEEEKNPQMNRFIKNMRLICRYCKKEFQSSEELIKHECVKPDLSCKYCQFITKDDDGFLKHVSEKHQELLLQEMSE